MPKLDDIISNKEAYPDTTQITLPDGSQITLGELRGGYLKDADYRRKTSELARQREEFERAAQLRAAELQAAEQRLAELAYSLIAQQQAGAQQAATNTSPEASGEDDLPAVKSLRQELQELKQLLGPMAQAVIGLDARMRQSALAYIAQQHRKVLEQLKKEDPDLDEQALIDFARQRAIPRLDDAYRLYRWDKLVERKAQEAKEAGLKEGYQKAKTETPFVPFRRAGVPAQPEAPKSMEEAMQQALKDPEVVGPLFGMPPKA